MPRMTLLLTAVLLLGGATGWSQSSAQQLVSAFAGAADLAHAAVSIDVVDLGSGRRVAAHRPELACIPASTQKLLTTAAALDMLGPDHRFRTRLLLEGQLTDGPHGKVLLGNVRILGGGDPSLGSPYADGVPGTAALLDRWADALGARGIVEIRGGIIGDGRYYPTDGVGYAWPWSDVGNYYGSGAYGLNVHENFYFLDFVQRQRVGATPLLQGTRPAVPGLTLRNELRSGPRGSGDQAYIYGAPFNYQHYVRGSIPVGTSRFTIKGSIPDPPLFTAQLLEKRLRERGTKISAPASSARLLPAVTPPRSELVDELFSPPLAELVDRTNLRSNNLYAETLLREINKSRGLERHELSSTRLVTEWLAARGLDVGGIQLEDGSGLATRNFFSAQFMTDFLLSQADNQRWVESIPLAGHSGSLRRALRGTAASGRLRAKSGSIGAVRCYAGYIDRADGTRLAFAVMVNNYTVSGSSLRRRMLYLLRDLCTAPV